MAKVVLMAYVHQTPHGGKTQKYDLEVAARKFESILSVKNTDTSRRQAPLQSGITTQFGEMEGVALI